MDLSQYLKQKRLASGLSQGEVAKELGYTSPQFISNWERGVSDPPVETLKQLCELYNINPDELFDRVLQDAISDLTDKLHKEIHGKKAARAK